MSYESQRKNILHRLSSFSREEFEDLALEVFRFQAQYNEAYAKFISLLNIDSQSISAVQEIPFLPIQFFKNYSIKTGQWPTATTFSSSGTTGDATSLHHVRDLDFYKTNTENGFSTFYGPPSGYCVLALLPSYLERTGSSLIYMADHFIRLSKHPKSGFFLNNTTELLAVLNALKKDSIPTLLLGVSFALLDLAESYPIDLQNVIIMETGGMKGRRKELTRAELHTFLKTSFQVKHIHSEYGMTELFSQAYSKGDGIFHCPQTMKVLAREITDPLVLQKDGKTGVLNIIDLANFDTISFIATEDLGRVHEDGSFEVLGRLDNSDIRGCNLLL
jgi:phenylacetate-coenzyme A ligase PaaK-like adenylate-forming protein